MTETGKIIEVGDYRIENETDKAIVSMLIKKRNLEREIKALKNKVKILTLIETDKNKMTKTVYIGARVSPEFRDLLKKVSNARGMNVSSFIRFLLGRELAKLGFLPEDYRRAYGILEGEEDSSYNSN